MNSLLPSNKPNLLRTPPLLGLASRLPRSPNPRVLADGRRKVRGGGPVRVATAGTRVEIHPRDIPPVVGGNPHEEQIEKVIYSFRFVTLLGVVGSMIGSFLCFLKIFLKLEGICMTGCVIIVNSFMAYFVSRAKVTSLLIEAIDVYLIGTVMLVFGMGLYELFISNLDIGKSSSSNKSSLFGLFMLQERPKWLEIKSVNELKTKLGHVIVMVLLVGLFEKSKKVVITSPLDLLCFAASVLFSSGGLFLLSKLKH